MTHKQFSAKGGKAGTGEAKARTSEQARAAVAARWAKTKRKPKASARRHNIDYPMEVRILKLSR